MSAAISGGGPPEGFVLLANGDLGIRELVALRLRDAGYEVATASWWTSTSLKTVNDERGHRAGDAVLRHVAERLRASTRLSDVVGRYGGDEFVLLLPETDLHHAGAAGEKIRREVAAAAVGVGASAAVDIRVSVGVACFDEEMTTASDLLDLADQALYDAKRLGRDRVVVAKDVAAA